MENASKALIIAGSILVSIIIIGLGVLIVNAGDGLKRRAVSSMSEQDIAAFNDPFFSFEGPRVSAQNVRSLIQKVESTKTSYNATEEGDEGYIIFESNFGLTDDDGNVDKSQIKSNHTFAVTCSTGDGGLINKITINDNTVDDD